MVICGRWQRRMKAVSLATHFTKKSFISSGSYEFLVGLVFFKKALICPIFSRLRKPLQDGKAECNLEIQSMPEIQCEAVHGTNAVHGERSTNRPADYTF